MSAGLMNRLKWGDAITVNGIPCHTDYAVAPGDRIRVRLEEPPAEYPAETGALTILYEDDYILIVDKPAGMLIHPSRSQFSGTLANRVLGHYRATGQDSAFHPVTRLDRDTFGIVLLAKNSHVHSLLQQTSIRKTYHALTFGGPAEERGVIDAPIGKEDAASIKRLIRDDGKPSVTHYEVLEETVKRSLVKLRLETGRTHQIRVHMAHLGCPVCGDFLYGTELPELPGRFALHSHELTLTHPLTMEGLHIVSPLPEQLRALLD